MSDPRYLDLAIRQIQGNIGLKNMSDPRYLDLAVLQIQSTWTWQLVKSKVTIILTWHIQGNDYPSLGMPKRMSILPGACPRGWPFSFKSSIQEELSFYELNYIW